MSGLDIGVLALQGAVSEHVEAFDRAFAARGLEGRARPIRKASDLAAVDGVALPGGESTTISKLLRAFELHDLLVARVRDEDLPVLGTCAGMILLSTDGDAFVTRTDTRLLGLMDMAVDRNAFGGQQQSFEAHVDVKGFEEPIPAVFIRAPAVTRTWGACESIGEVDLGEDVPSRVRHAIVAAKQGNRFAFAFHPELTADPRVHGMFLDAVDSWKRR